MTAEKSGQDNRVTGRSQGLRALQCPRDAHQPLLLEPGGEAASFVQFVEGGALPAGECVQPCSRLLQNFAHVRRPDTKLAGKRPLRGTRAAVKV
jgi:hypothetical protein